MEKTTGCFAASYAEARAGFLAAAKRRGLEVATNSNALKGTHGVEGFCGSGCQRALLEDDDMARRIEAAAVAVLLVHAVNPYGFSHLRRVNEDNVDMNRNFRDFADYAELNPAYAQVHGLLLPAEWPPTDANRAEIFAAIGKMGMPAFQAAVSAGQGSHKDGLFYCGSAPTWSNRTIRSLLGKYGAGRKRIGWIDIHTGLGPYGHGEKIFAGANDAAEFARAKAFWGADVMSYYTGNSASAEVQGSMVMSIYAECPQAEVTGMGLEFGTVPFEAVLGALRGDHWLAIHPETAPAKRDAIRRAMRDAFYIEADDWKGMVLGQSRTAVMQAVLGLSAG
jgi:hypothetical protein